MIKYEFGWDESKDKHIKTNLFLRLNEQKNSHIFFPISLYLLERKIRKIQKMYKETAILFTAVALTIVGLSTLYEAPSDNIRVNKQPQTVPYVDVASYLGAWYEQAVIPYYFERGCSKTIAKYSLNKDGTIRVDNSCVRNGKLVESVGKAIPEDDTHAKLKVEFVETLDVGAQYWVVRLAKDYSYSVVSSPNYKYMWILYREPKMPETLYQQIIADLKKDEFPVDKLVRTQQ